MKKHFYPSYNFVLECRDIKVIISSYLGFPVDMMSMANECDHGEDFRGQPLLLQSWQRAEEVAGNTGLVGVAEELGVKVLVSLQGEVLALGDLLKCLVQAGYVRVGHAGHAVISELLDADGAITCQCKYNHPKHTKRGYQKAYRQHRLF